MSVDFQQHQVSFVGTASLTVPHFGIAAKVVDSQTQALVKDLTGANNIDFVVRVAGWTQAAHMRLAQLIAPIILRIAAGVDPAFENQ